MKIDELKNDEQLNFWFKEYDFNDEIQSKIYQYYELIFEYNKVMNLTGIDDLYGVYLKHFYDSLTITKIINFKDNCRVADVGTGAGFPGIILAICYPNIHVSLIEPMTKRCKFLEIVKEKLNLSNIDIINKRSEDVNIKFDIVTSRAVARLNILLELCIPLVKVNGFFIALKGSAGDTEIVESKNALNKLDSSIDKIDHLLLPIENSIRINIKIKKNKETKIEYPRNFGRIKQAPL